MTIRIDFDLGESLRKRFTIVLWLPRSHGQQIDDLLDGFVGAVIGGFPFVAGW